MIYVKVGFGFFLEMTHDEALAFIEKKVSMINSKIDVLTKDAAKVKAHIKLVLQVRCTYTWLHLLQHLNNNKNTRFCHLILSVVFLKRDINLFFEMTDFQISPVTIRAKLMQNCVKITMSLQIYNWFFRVYRRSRI